MGHNMKYTPSDINHNSNIYVEEFFSGADIKIEVDGKPCEFISGVSYSLTEQVNPLYGYSSNVFDDVSIGNRIVTGFITVPLLNFDTLIKDYTKKDTPVLQKAFAYDTPDDWIEKPSWVTDSNIHNPSLDVDQEDDVVDDNLNEDGGGITDGGDEQIPLITGERNRIVRKEEEVEKIPTNLVYSRIPEYEIGTDTFFLEEYSESSTTLAAIKNKFRNNYVNMRIYVNNILRAEIISLVLRTVEVTYNANDEPIMESISFIARDLVENNN